MRGHLGEHRWGIALGFVAFALSAILIFSTPGYEPAGDSADYRDLAVTLLDGEGYTREPFDKPTALRGPLYPVFLAAVFGVTDRDATAGRLATAAVGGLAVVLLYLLVHSLWGRRPALMAGGLAALSPLWLASNIGFFTEPLFLVLELTAMLVALRFTRSPKGLLLPAAVGVLCGLAALTRTNGILLLLPLVPALVLAVTPRRRGLLVGGVAVLAACLTLVPWTVRNEAAFDRFIPFTTQTGYALIYIFNDTARAADGDYSLEGVEAEAPPLPDGLRTDEAAYGDLLVDQSLEYAREHPAYVAKAFVLNTLRTLELWSGSVTGFYAWSANGAPGTVLDRLVVPSSYLLYALALAGLVVLIGRRVPRPPWFLAAVPVILLLSPALTAGALRYRVPFDPLLLALGGLALASLGRRRPTTMFASPGER